MNRLHIGLVTLIFITFTYTAKGQDSYSLELEEVNLTQVIDTLSRLLDYQFSFPSAILRNDIRSKVSIKNSSIDDLLMSSFTVFDIEYAQPVVNTILLRPKNVTANQSSTSQAIVNKIKIKGHIRNSNSNPIEYAAISMPTYNLVEFSDKNGAYEFEINNYKQTDEVTIHMLGYELQTLRLEQLIHSPTIELQSKPIDIPEITILEKIPKTFVSTDALHLTNRGLQNLGSGLAGRDLLRSVQMLPGIDASDDSSTDLKIRGSNADETLIILDGIPLYNTSHYYGIFSAINTDYVKQVSIYKNNQPIEYGNKTAGVVQFASGNKTDQDVSGKLNLNLLESSLILSAPLSTSSFMTISGRKTLRDITNTSFNSIGKQLDRNEKGNAQVQNFMDREAVIRSEPEFNFWDIQGKYVLHYNDNNTCQLNFFRSRDIFSNELDNNFIISKEGTRFLSDEETSISEIWNNTGINLQWNSKLSQDLQLDVNAYFSKYDILNMTHSVTEFYRVQNEEVEESIDQNQSQFNKVQDLGLMVQLRKSLDNTDFHTGFKLVEHTTAFELEFSEAAEIEQNKSSIEFTSYGEIDHTFMNSLKLAGGIRGHYYTGTKRTYLSPQLSATYPLSKLTTVKTSITKNHQFLRELSIESNFGNQINRWVLAEDEKLPVSSSINSMLGLTFKKNKFVLDTELFYKKMNNVTELSLATSKRGQPSSMNPVSPMTLFIGQGRSYGIDLLLSADFTYINSQIAYTLSQIDHSFEAINRGRYFNAPNDRRHQLKLINEFLINDFTLGINYSYSSGRIYTDLNKLINVSNFDRSKTSPRDFRSRLPHYHRLDLSLQYSLKHLNTPLSIGVGIFNVLDRNNVKYQQQIQTIDPRTGSALKNLVLGTNSDLLGRTLNLSVGLEF